MSQTAFTPSGVLAVNKPQGMTSFDVIAKLRGIIRIKRLGHAGTLDPMAVGVLPVFAGKATRCCDILPDKRKSYTAGFKLGITSDTQDITGECHTVSDMRISRAALEQVCQDFIGDIMQLPPMYSAVKINGKRLYELAREGKTVERSPRSIHIQRLTVTEYDADSRTGVLEIDCLQGTYVRTLINDIGQKLGCGGVMTSLVRTRSGTVTLSQCRTLEEIERISAAGGLEGILMPTDSVFAAYEPMTLNEKDTRLYKNGVKLQCNEDKTFRIYGADGGFIGLGCADGHMLRVVKNFY